MRFCACASRRLEKASATVSRMRFTLLSLAMIHASVCFLGCDAKAISKAPTASAEAAPTGSLGSRASASDAPNATEANGFVVVDINPTSADVISVIHGEALKAKAQGLKPFVEFAATWCEPCQALKKSLDDPLMRAAFKGTYIIRLDFDAWGPHLAGSGFSPGAIPVIYEVADTGKPTGRTIDGAAWADNIPTNMAPPLGKFFHGS
jgi:hypothetical protein